MAPKGKRQQKKKAQAAFRATPEQVKEMESKKKASSLLQIAEEEERAEKATTPPSQQGRDMDSKIIKMINDHFSTCSPYSKFVKANENGDNLFAVLYKDKLAGVTQGKLYYVEKRKEFDDAVTLACFHILDEEEETDDMLLDALGAFMENPKATKGLIQWMDMATDVNQMCMAGFMKQLFKLYPGASLSLANLLVNVMQFIKRLKLDTKYPEMVRAMRGHFDSALDKLLASYKANGSGSDLWWDFIKPVADLVFDNVQDIIDIMAEKDSLDKVHAQMLRAQATQCGKTLVAAPMMKFKRAKVLEEVQAIVDTMKGGDLTEARVDACKRRFMDWLKEQGGPDVYHGVLAKTATVMYNGKPTVVAIAGVLDLFQTFREAHVVSEAVRHGVVAALWCETEICGQPVKTNNSVEASLVSKNNAARESLRTIASLETADQIQQTLKQKKDWLLQRSSLFKIELAFWQHQCLEGGGTAAWHDLLVGVFCVDGKAKNISDSVTQIAKIEQGGLLKFGGMAHAVTLSLIKEIVDSIRFKQLVSFNKLGSGDWASRVQVAVGNMCQFVEGASEAKLLVGKEAMQKHVASLVEDSKKTGEAAVAIRPDRLKIFKTYKFLMTEQQVLEVQGVAPVVPQSDKSDTKSDEIPAAKPAKRKSTDAASSVAKLFKN